MVIILIIKDKNNEKGFDNEMFHLHKDQMFYILGKFPL